MTLTKPKAPRVISVATSTTHFRVLAALNELHLRYRDCHEGDVATYIPELAKANPDWFAICVVTADGQVYEIGDADRQFTIQSVSKPFVYGLALEDHGREAVLSKVGVEPTGDAFNSIIKLDSANRPHNPCVNAGAIATTSLIKGADPTSRLNRLLELFGKYFGRRVHVDMSVFMSERTSGHRNRAIAYLMLNFGMISNNVDQILDLYFQQCSILGNCRDLAVMAATLANNGVNPITGKRAVRTEYLRDILTVMYTCGMYDFAGQWGYSVGLPAKSGVTGSIIAVVPKHLGIAVYSPRLDDRGNSVRGIRVCQDLSREFGMHMFDCILTGEERFRTPGAPQFDERDSRPLENHASSGTCPSPASPADSMGDVESDWSVTQGHAGGGD
jgi:glutaminase